jgi:hypothetical protein
VDCSGGETEQLVDEPDFACRTGLQQHGLVTLTVFERDEN